MDKRDEILLAAAEEFASNGYPGTSFGTIGARLGMHRNALQYYVESKPDLASTIAWTAFHRSCFLAEDLSRYCGAAGIARLLRCAAEQYVGDPFARAALRLMEQRHLIPADLPVTYEAWIPRVAGLLQNAVCDGQIDPDVDVDDLALRLLSTFAGTRMVCEAVGQLDLFPERAHRTACDLLRAHAPRDVAGPAAPSVPDDLAFVGVPRPATGGSARQPALRLDDALVPAPGRESAPRAGTEAAPLR